MLIPFKASFVGDGYYANNIFDAESPINRDNCNACFIELHKSFNKNGVELNTKDLNTDANVHFELHLDVRDTCISNVPKYLILYESPLIKPINLSKRHHERYRKVFTWSDDLVDGQKFIKINNSFKFNRNNWNDWQKRKNLCCLIASNKAASSSSSLELYSERIKTIRWFEQNAPQDFDLYGGGWDSPAARPGFANRVIRKLRSCFIVDDGTVHFVSYRGRVVSKSETMQKYRFSICYENVRDLSGYITEKIWDSLFAGCVPVYWGASNVTDYIPEDCFIDRRKFSSHEALYKFLASMSESQYTAYQERISAYLVSDKARPFSAEAFAETVAGTIMKDLGLAG